MSGWMWIVIAVAVIAVVAMVAWAASRRRRTQRLQDRFGPEYERVVDQRGDRRSAESELIERERRREELELRPLTTAARNRYAARWQRTQAEFVDAPVDAVREADRLVTEVMTDRGYPMNDFDRRAADISVDHADLVDNYRSAHDIAVRSADAGDASTEDLRQAMVHYRALFEELLSADDDQEVRQAG